MIFNELSLFRGDVHRITLNGIGVWVGRGAVYRGHKLNRQRPIVANGFEGSHQLQPIPMPLSAGKPIGIGHMEIHQTPLGLANGFVGVNLFDVQMEGIQTDTTIIGYSFGQS